MEEEGKYQLFVPARPSDQSPPVTGGNISIYLQQPPRRSFPWVFALIMLISVGALFFLARLALVTYYLDQMHKVDHDISAQYRPAPTSVHYPAGTSAAFPPSSTLRLVGTVNMGHVDYVAQSSADVSVLIPGRYCHVVDGGPICHYQGRSITPLTGSS